MKPNFEVRVTELGLNIPTAPNSVANYVPTYRTGDLLFISGQLCTRPGGELVAVGAIGDDVSLEDGIDAARACAVNILSQIRSTLGTLDRVKQVVRLGGFIAASPGFSDHARVMNGASDLMVEIFGGSGRHTRSTIGVSSLPMQAAVEVEALIEVA